MNFSRTTMRPRMLWFLIGYTAVWLGLFGALLVSACHP